MLKKVQIISPSDGITKIPREVTEETKNKLEQKTNLSVKFSKNLFEKFDVEKVLEDIYDAYFDKEVDLIMCYKGGWYAKELLNRLDFEIIEKNKKPMIGYSDNTILLNAIYLKTGQKNYYGPTFSAFNMDKGFEFTLQNFNKVVRDKGKFKINISKEYSYDKKWYINQEDRVFIKNENMQIINKGEATGILLGGHLSSFAYLLSNGFEVKDSDVILALEEDGKQEEYLIQFKNKLEEIMCNIGKNRIKAILIGRSEKPISCKQWKNMLQTLDLDIPIICNLDFGHTTPTLSIPIGEKIKI